MTAMVDSEPMIGRASSASASGFKIEFIDDWKQAIACWSSDGQETAFQYPLWFDIWYKAFNNVSPLIAIAVSVAAQSILPVAVWCCMFALLSLRSTWSARWKSHSRQVTYTTWIALVRRDTGIANVVVAVWPHSVRGSCIAWPP